MTDSETRHTQIHARITNVESMVSMFGDTGRLRNRDFAFKWHAFPTTKEEIQATLKDIGVDGVHYTNFAADNFDAVIHELNDVLPRGCNLDELNYLAVKMDSLTESQHDIFRSVIEAGRHCDSMKDVINITENLDCFSLQPAFSAEQYGEFLLDMEKDNTSAVFRYLESSANPDERAFAQYILRLEASVDAAAYGRAAVEQENGAFTEQGLLTENGDFREAYHGLEDIPAEYRVFAFPEPEAMEKPSVMDKLAAAKDAAAKGCADKPAAPPKSHDAEL